MPVQTLDAHGELFLRAAHRAKPPQAVIDEIVAELNELVTVARLNKNMSAALISLAYSIRKGARDESGRDTLKDSLVIWALNRAQFRQASFGMLAWRFNAKGKEDPRLIILRHAEMGLFDLPDMT